MLWGRRYLLTVCAAVRPAITISGRSLRLHAPDQFGHEDRKRLFAAWYRTELRKRARPLVEKWARQLKLGTPMVFIQQMKTKWGSSSPARGAIRLNLELAKFEPDCLDYVVLHELAHFKVPDHSPKFRAILDRNLGGWETLRARLNAHTLEVVASRK
jgi:predicted metal-dependent hydrolase